MRIRAELIASQFHAALSMLAECVEKCPPEHWDAKPPYVVGEQPFWMVAYHTLCFVDCYMAANNERFEAEIGQRKPGFHPAGMKELSEEFPSRRFERDEIRPYVEFCRDRVRSVLEGETEPTLAGASGFSWLDISRGELHLYNLRHLTHHTGQLTAFLRRVGVETKWVKAGWRVTQPQP